MTAAPQFMPSKAPALDYLKAVLFKKSAETAQKTINSASSTGICHTANAVIA